MEIEYNKSNIVHTERLIKNLEKFESKLFNLFDLAHQNTDLWQEKGADDDFEILFEKIKNADLNHEFNPDQTNKITKIMLNIYPSIDLDMKNQTLDFLISHMNSENVYEYFKIAKDANDEKSIDECISFINEITGMKIERNNRSLSIEIGDEIQTSYEDILDHLSTLFAIYDDISLKLTPGISMNSETFKYLILEYGIYIHTLFAIYIYVDDDIANTIICNCPNLKSLTLMSDEIKGSGLKNLNNLKELVTLELSECSKLKCLPNIDNLTKLEELILLNCEKLRELPSLKSLTHLKGLNLSNCNNIAVLELDDLINLEELHLEKLINLFKLDVSGFKHLKALNLHGCFNLSSIKGLSELEGLVEIFFGVCENLKEFPELHPRAKLKTLHLEGCQEITHLPNMNFTLLEELNLSECPKLSDGYRLRILTSLLDQNFCYWVYKLNGFGITNQTGLNKFIAAKTKEKLNNPATSPEMQVLLSEFISDLNHRFIFDNPTLKTARNNLLANETVGNKNPIRLFNHLKALSKQEVNFQTPSMTVQVRNFAINMDQLKKLIKAAVIRREDLPKNATREAFTQLISSLSAKFKQDKDQTFTFLNNLKVTIAELEAPISYLKDLLLLNGETVTEPESKWRAVLNSILNETCETENGCYFTNQEITLITTLKGIGHCIPKRNEGIAAAYEIMNPKFRYKISLSKWESAEDKAATNEKNETFEFIKNFVDSNPINTLEAIKENVNTGGELSSHAGNILPKSKEFWEWDDFFNDYEFDSDFLYPQINDNGALTLLETPMAQEKITLFTNQAVKSLMQAQFLGENEIMNELSGASQILQSVHQSLYMQNVIGHHVGVSEEPGFDWFTALILDKLFEKTAEEMLEVFFKHVTPKTVVENLVQNLNNAPSDIRNALQFVLLDDKFFENKETCLINEAGALELLKEAGYLQGT